MKKAFTLAEMMIVLVVIAVITAILLPAARHATPDENILKFKKAHNTLYTTIRELVNSDKYYLDGDLGVKPNGDLVDSQTYFCETMADILNAKKVNCPVVSMECSDHSQNFSFWNSSFSEDEWPLSRVDEYCVLIEEKMKNESNDFGITLNDGTTIFETGPYCHFGAIWVNPIEKNQRLYGNPTFWHHVTNMPDFDVIYKVVCIDIDDVTSGEAPFAYGVRADGKIIAGARAKEWLEKSINQK